ncbi:ROK family transcriptional regulator [Streptomyces himalayensis]|uniref:ROK family transcriptional regulator n=1 Tax=Streptomyces himalayensis subsp. himalayensis TaxID=2756131 RepID=A0A7W0DRS6_9ACTN|nr:ROK family transcriptional regulator [Streptomyces himalayensis]MBA2949284.1 ROK family transcriptional regulator [Streptomyces himalayensis subsp. himalayensis]
MAGTGSVSTGTPGTPRVLRAMNDRAALDLLLEHGPLSRTRIGKLTGLSKPTASQLLARLEAAGLVIATGTSEGLPGPSAQLYAVNPAAARVAGLDVTPTGIRAAVADITGRTVGTYELPTPGRSAQGAIERVLHALDGAAKDAGLHRTDIHRLVIGTPGAFDPTTGNLRYASHLPGWHSPRLLEELAAALGPLPFEVENDVNLAAVAEQRIGEAQGCENFTLLWGERGFGAAVVIGGRLHRGATGGAGEVAFLPLPGAPLVRNVARSNAGGFEELAGRRAILRLARDHGLTPPPGGSLTQKAAAVVAEAARTPEAGEAVLAEYATRLATGLAAIVAVVDPELIVLAGAVITAGGEQLRSLIQSELAELAVPRPVIRLSTMPDHPVLCGALQSALGATRDEVFDTTDRTP